MGIFAELNFTGQLSPCTYSKPNYRDIDISNFAWTEARFLLWRIYVACNIYAIAMKWVQDLRRKWCQR